MTLKQYNYKDPKILSNSLYLFLIIGIITLFSTSPIEGEFLEMLDNIEAGIKPIDDYAPRIIELEEKAKKIQYTLLLTIFIKWLLFMFWIARMQKNTIALGTTKTMQIWKAVLLAGLPIINLITAIIPINQIRKANTKAVEQTNIKKSILLILLIIVTIFYILANFTIFGLAKQTVQTLEDSRDLTLSIAGRNGLLMAIYIIECFLFAGISKNMRKKYLEQNPTAKDNNDN